MRDDLIGAFAIMSIMIILIVGMSSIISGHNRKEVDCTKFGGIYDYPLCLKKEAVIKRYED